MPPSNLFTDVKDEPEQVPTVPRIQVIEVDPERDYVVLEIAMIDSQGHPVLTLNRLCLRQGDTFDLTDCTINLSINYKE